MCKLQAMKPTAILALITALILLICAGCSNIAPAESASSEPESSIPAESASDSASIAAEPLSVYDTLPDDPANMVDERFELLSLVFRLAGREEYSDDLTEYQQKVISEFNGYSNHEAVKYAAKLPFGYDAVFRFSVHIYKQGENFALIDDISSLVDDGRWTEESAAEFLPLLNDFYTASNFAAFYQSNIEFYKAETKKFVDADYSKIDLEWFGNVLH